MKRRGQKNHILLAVLTGLAAGSAVAQDPGPRSYIDTGLLIGARQVDGTRAAGLRLTVADGWKTYWRSPGEAGIPPRFDWSRSTNLASAEVAWPRPELFDSFGYLTIGYQGETVLPLRLVPEDPARPIGLMLDVELGVCREICVFEQATIEAEIAPDDDGPGAAAVAAAEARVTPLAADAGVTAVSCTIAGGGADRAFTAVVEFDAPPGEAHVALEGPGESWFHETETVQDGNRIEVASTLSLPEEGAWIDRSDVRLTVLAEHVAADIVGCAG